MAKPAPARKGEAGGTGAQREGGPDGRRRAGTAGLRRRRSCRSCFHRVHRVPQRHLPSGASDFQGNRGGECPWKADGCDGKRSAPFLQLNLLPPLLFSLSHRGRFKAVCRHVEEDGGFSPALRAQINAGVSLAALGREQPTKTPRAPGSNRFPRRGFLRGV